MSSVVTPESVSNLPTDQQPTRAPGPSRTWRKGFLVTLVLVALVDALGIYGVFTAWTVRSWGILAFLIVALVVINIVYFSRRAVAAKYLVPGLLFLLVYQVFVIIYTGAAAFTNYGDGHNSTKEDAINAILANSADRLPDSPTYAVTVVAKGTDLYFLTVDPTTGKAELGGAGEPLHGVKAQLEDGKAVSVAGFDTLKLQDILDRQKDISALEAPLSDDPNAGYLRTTDGSTAYVYRSALVYDAKADTLTDARSGKVFTVGSSGNFVASDGTKIEPGWKVNVGFHNFASVLTDKALRGPFLSVLVWTFFYAIMSVFGTFVLGLFLALVLNHPMLRGRRIYRSLLVMPYAFPAFLAAMVWQGMLNQQYGIINQLLLGGANVPWLADPWLARFSVIAVNLWMGVPYMFLICTGAIQSLPPDVEEAAKVDGANPWRILISIKMPLLLVSTAPLLISSFAFNFNNFNAIFLLTGGGPMRRPTDLAGATDILISFVYRIAFGGVNRQYGLACAISILIFIIVATVSVVSFRRTRSLEELN